MDALVGKTEFTFNDLGSNLLFLVGAEHAPEANGENAYQIVTAAKVPQFMAYALQRFRSQTDIRLNSWCFLLYATGSLLDFIAHLVNARD